MKVMTLRKAYSGERCLMNTKAGLKIQTGPVCLRQIFDSLCHEYSLPTIEQKLEFIEQMKNLFKCDLIGLLRLYIKDTIHQKKSYRLDGIKYALQDLSSYTDEAKKFISVENIVSMCFHVCK